MSLPNGIITLCPLSMFTKLVPTLPELRYKDSIVRRPVAERILHKHADERVRTRYVIAHVDCLIGVNGVVGDDRDDLPVRSFATYFRKRCYSILSSFRPIVSIIDFRSTVEPNVIVRAPRQPCHTTELALVRPARIFWRISPAIPGTWTYRHMSSPGPSATPCALAKSASMVATV
jgi:hypothetical protein